MHHWKYNLINPTIFINQHITLWQKKIILIQLLFQIVLLVLLVRPTQPFKSFQYILLYYNQYHIFIMMH